MLTKKQRDLLEFIQKRLSKDGVPPSFDEMKEKLALEIKKDPNMRVLIRSDAQTKYKVNEKVMTACAEIGANDLIYSAFEE